MCEWVGQNSKFELQEDSSVLHCTVEEMRKDTHKDLAVEKLFLE